MEDNNTAPAASEQELEAAPQAAAEADTAPESEETVDWKAEAEKAKELANNYKIRAEKAEKKSKEEPKADKPKESPEMGISDMYALITAKVPEEDFGEVADYAKLKGISVKDALKSPVVRTLLSHSAETRATAAAANTGTARRSAGKLSDETVLERASKGQLPQTDDELDRLMDAKWNSKKK